MTEMGKADSEVGITDSGVAYIYITGDIKVGLLLSCQPRVTVMSCFVFKVIRDLESIDHLCINPIHRIGLIHK